MQWKIITLKTEEGFMNDIFIDQEFTLSTIPLTNFTQTRSNMTMLDSKGIIHPIKITQEMADGNIKSIYDISNNKTKSITPIEGSGVFYEIDINKTNEEIYKFKSLNLSWDKFYFSTN